MLQLVLPIHNLDAHPLRPVLLEVQRNDRLQLYEKLHLLLMRLVRKSRRRRQS